MNVFVFGSSLTSSYWNGAATYYRGIYKSLSRLGYRVTFAEPEIYDRQKHPDSADCSFAEVRVYKTPDDISRLLSDARHRDVVIKHSGVGAEDELLERELLTCRTRKNRILFWDVDAPATLARVEASPTDAFRRLVPHYDAIFTYGGGLPVVTAYRRLGAQDCIPIYNGLDPETHYPVAPDPRLTCDLAFVGHRLPDRESRVENLFLAAATLAPDMSFALGGEGWANKELPPNVRWLGHIPTEFHNVVNSSARMVLNINRDSMASVGFSPPTRVFEAAGAGACLITDDWQGIEEFFALESEILRARSAQDVVNHLRRLAPPQSAKIGFAMQCRALRQHTYDLRAREVHVRLKSLFAPSEKSTVRNSPAGYPVSPMQW